MTIPYIRCAWTLDGEIEAVHGPHRLVVDSRTGRVVLGNNVKEGTDMFRWLVKEARRHVAR